MSAFPLTPTPSVRSSRNPTWSLPLSESTHARTHVYTFQNKRPATVCLEKQRLCCLLGNKLQGCFGLPVCTGKLLEQVVSLPLHNWTTVPKKHVFCFSPTDHFIKGMIMHNILHQTDRCCSLCTDPFRQTHENIRQILVFRNLQPPHHVIIVSFHSVLEFFLRYFLFDARCWL